MNARVERWYPYVIAGVASASYLLFLRSTTVPKTATDVLTAVVSLSGIALGFLGAIQSILIAIDDRQIIRELRDTGTYVRIIQFIHSAMWWSFALALLSVIGLVSDFEKHRWPPVAVAGWVFCLLAAGLCCARVISVFQAVLRSR